MRLVNASMLRALFTGLSTLFHNALKGVPDDYLDTCMVVPSSGKGMDYAWLSRFPKMRKWVGDKHIKTLALGKYYVKNDDFEATIVVDRNDIEDDQLGIYNSQAMMAGESAGELYGDLANDLKNNAFTNTGMDGKTFYATDHELTDSNGAVATYSNRGTAALSAASQAAVVASYGAARTAIMGMKDEEGQSLGLVPDLLEVPPALEATANLIAGAEKLADDTPNPYRGTCRVKVNPALISATGWMLHVTKKASIKPFVIQDRKRPTFVSQTAMESESVFMRKEFRYGAEARAAGAYGLFQLSYGSTGTG